MADRLEALLFSFPEMRAPNGFSRRLYARLDEPRTIEPHFNALRTSGMVCLAYGLVLLLVTHSPVLSLVPQIFETLKGVLQ